MKNLPELSFGLWEDLVLPIGIAVAFSAPIILIGSFVMYIFSRDLNAILTGEEAAEHLGINTELVKKIILVLGSLVTATAVSVGGIIGFVGLIVPHYPGL